MRKGTAYGHRALPSAARRVPQLVALALLLVLVLVPRPAVPAEMLLHGEGLLWRIERSGVAPSYLFGTMHSIDERVRDLPGPVVAALDATESLTLEIVETDEVLTLAGERMVITEGRLLDEILEPDFYAQVVGLIVARYGIPDAQLKLFKPWAVMVLLSFPPDELAGEAAGILPLDGFLQAGAMTRGIPVYGLETVDEQLDVFDGMLEDDQIAMLKGVVRDNAKIEQMWERLIGYYLARDISAIHAWMTAQMGGSESDLHLLAIVMERFINARNGLMADRMASRLAEGNAFMAVGAMHLPGERGILHLLEMQGYTVTRIY